MLEAGWGRADDGVRPDDGEHPVKRRRRFSAALSSAATLASAMFLMAVPTSAVASTVASSLADGTTLVAQNTGVIPETDCLASLWYYNGEAYSPCEEPTFSGANWTPAVTADGGRGNGAYFQMAGSQWVGQYGAPQGYGTVQDYHWTQFNTTFDRPSGASLGVRVLGDNAMTGIFVNGHQLDSCTRAAPCGGFSQQPYAFPIPDGDLQDTGNQLNITVLNFSPGVSSGGLDYQVVTRGPSVLQKAANASGSAGGTVTTSGSFQEAFQADAGSAISITADNTVGTFVDHGNGTWTWTYPSSQQGSGTIHVTATDTNGLSATDSFDYNVAPGPTVSIPGGCIQVYNRVVDTFTATVSNVSNASSGFYVAVENSPSNPWDLSQLDMYGWAYANGPVLVDARWYGFVPANASSLWVDLRSFSNENVPLISEQVPICVVDSTPPSTTDDAPSGWQNRDTTVHLTATDSGSGVASTHYSVDGGPDQTGTSVSIPAPADHSDDGVHTISYYSVDKAGNKESAHTATVKIDTTPPTISGVAKPAANANGWNNGPVTVSFSCSDGQGGSGLAGCTSDQTVSGEGQGQSVTGTATDNAGNTAQTTVGKINIDLTPPVVSYSGNAGTYTIADSVNITCSASDALSGLDSQSCQDITGDAYTFALGENDFSASATDKAGNTGSAKTSFQVQVTTDSLCTLTKRWVSQAGIATSLCAKLSAAQASIASGDQSSKDGQLGAYRNELSAQSGKSIAADKATILATLSKSL